MNTLYPIAHIIHLYCAIAFIGGVIFEALILSALHSKNVSQASRREAERAISQRAIKVMPFIVSGVFLSGITMAYRYAGLLATPFSSGSLALQLSIKILLSVSILMHFFVAVHKMKTHTLTAAWSKYIHTAVLCQMLAIVFLAKSMFYFQL